MKDVIYEQLSEKHFAQAIQLANRIHGDGYLDESRIADWTARGISNQYNCSYAAFLNDKSDEKPENTLIGFRITYAPEYWTADKWCTPDLWKVPENKCCYFKCNTVDENYQGLGIGKNLLNRSITTAKKQGAQAGISHLWKQSPNNSAVAYFTRCGGELVKYHPDKWNEESKQGYNCILCGHDCHCEAAEMIIHFNKKQ